MTEQHRDLWWPSPTVERAQVLHLQLDEPLRMQHGGELPAVQVSYESWGELSTERDNAVLVVHPMTADPHASGGYLEQEPGWWEDLIGPGRAIDTDRDFVVCPNLVGGCYGTTGPCLPAADGEPWRDRFPLLTPRDMMAVQRRFVEQLGIRRLRLVIGPSMGGMVAWEWAAAGTGMVDRVAVVAAPLVTTAQQIGLNWLQRRGIELDIEPADAEDGGASSRFGQMIARGIGMISYRSPSGLEEKFGRDWFKKPGATLAERGMFNIESWLRFHGKRITKRFDPYTWMLYSRAMDLHDLAAERSDLIASLGQVDCQVLIAGISTDNLYPPQDVHLGADMLAHLGKPVHYAEIRSLHGHDAFLLETTQIDRILRGADAAFAGPAAQPARSEREVREVRLGVLGAGRVATAFAEMLAQRGPDLAARRGLRIRIAAVADPGESVTLPAAFGDVELLRDPGQLVVREDIDVVLDLTRGSDSSPLVREALQRRRNVVTPNKRLVHDHGPELEALALQHGVRLAWHDSMAAGWPLMYALERPLVRGDLSGVDAVLSAAGNVIYELIADGADHEAALQEAIGQGLTEVDPELDLSGWDAAQKLALILTRITRQRVAVQDIDVHRLDAVDPALVRLVEAEGLCVRPVAWARLRADRVEATVRPMVVRRDSHLGANRGGNHVVVLHSNEEGESVQMGRGAGTVPVATAVWNDLLGVLDPERSWTGRFPRATQAPQAPTFGRYVRRREAGSGIERLDVAAPGALPLLED